MNYRKLSIFQLRNSLQACGGHVLPSSHSSDLHADSNNRACELVARSVRSLVVLLVSARHSRVASRRSAKAQALGFLRWMNKARGVLGATDRGPRWLWTAVCFGRPADVAKRPLRPVGPRCFAPLNSLHLFALTQGCGFDSPIERRHTPVPLVQAQANLGQEGPCTLLRGDLYSM